MRKAAGSFGCRELRGLDQVARVLEVDQTPIGKTPRSCPATYVGFWDDIRRLYAGTTESRVRGYGPGRFSFNTPGGRCDACEGQGVQTIEMSFLPNVKVLYLADVGQNRVEGIDIVTAGGNYGWNLREGAFWFDPSGGAIVTAPGRPPPPNMIDPIAQYDHDDGLAVVGGFVYPGSAIPALAGRYVCADWGSFGSPSGRLFYLDSNNIVTELRIGLEDRRLGLWVKGFGEGTDGELYVFASRWLGPSGNTGRMLKLTPAPDPHQPHRASAGGGTVTVNWSGGAGPFLLEKKPTVTESNWAARLCSFH